MHLIISLEKIPRSEMDCSMDMYVLFLLHLFIYFFNYFLSHPLSVLFFTMFLTSTQCQIYVYSRNICCKNDISRLCYRKDVPIYTSIKTELEYQNPHTITKIRFFVHWIGSREHFLIYLLVILIFVF